MAKKRTAALEREIREALSRVPKKSLKSRAELDAEIDTALAAMGLPAERYEVARALGYQYPKRPPSKPKSLTSVNLFALKEMTLDHGPTFPARVEAVHVNHLKHALALGYLEPTSHNQVRLTPEGREIVADAIIKDIERLSNYAPTVSTLVLAEKRAEVLAREQAKHQAKLARLERGLAQLQAGA